MKVSEKRGFTLLEILVAVVVLTVLTSTAVVVYQGYRDRVAMMVDETNQKVLQAAAKLYAYDNNALPGSLSDLRPVQLRRAYALVQRGKHPYTLLTHLGATWRSWVGVGVAEAHFIPARYYSWSLETITCPSDSTPPTSFDSQGDPQGGMSYGVEPGAAGKPLSWLLDPSQAGVALIIETEDGGRTQAFRHENGSTAVLTTVSGNAVRTHIPPHSSRRLRPRLWFWRLP